MDQPRPHLSHWNVVLAALFLVLSAIISITLKLGLGTGILIAGLRCYVQLSLVGVLLDPLFRSKNPYLTALVAVLLTVLGSFETVFQRSKKQFKGMFLIVFVSMISILSIGLIGSKLCLTDSTQLWWEPKILIPICGMLVGNSVSSISIGINHVLQATTDNSDKIEMYLAFGASRFEAMQPILTDAVRNAVLPSINAMSVVGIISIPGMMTGTKYLRPRIPTFLP